MPRLCKNVKSVLFYWAKKLSILPYGHQFLQFKNTRYGPKVKAYKHPHGEETGSLYNYVKGHVVALRPVVMQKIYVNVRRHVFFLQEVNDSDKSIWTDQIIIIMISYSFWSIIFGLF